MKTLGWIAFAVALAALLCVGGSRCRAGDAVPGAAGPASKPVVEGNSAFALDLYSRLREREGNLFFSPWSISAAFGMTYAGARGETEAEMAKVLHATLPQKDLHPAWAALIASLDTSGKDKGYKLNVANALWGQRDEPFLPDFLSLTQSNYGAGLRLVDYKSDTEGARKKINVWVEEQTNQKIKDLIKPGVLDPMTRLVLVNAIYFKGDWAKQFPKGETKDAPFHLADGKDVQAALMHLKEKFSYMETPTLQVLQMPYKGGDLAMLVLLPVKADGLPEVEKSLTLDTLAGWIGRLDSGTKVDVFLPKFRMTGEFSLKETLESMGMRLAFSDAKADFSGMNGRKDDLYIQAAVHKAFVDVNEEGTEAAAATAVTLGERGGPPRPPPVFRADHPFLFLIRDLRSGSLLFIGRVANPAAGGE